MAKQDPEKPVDLFGYHGLEPLPAETAGVRLGREVVSGATGLGAQAMETAAAVSRVTPAGQVARMLRPEAVKEAEEETREAAASLAEWAENLRPPPGLRMDLAHALGSALPFMATTGMGAAMGIPTMLSAGATGAGVALGPAYYNAKRRGLGEKAAIAESLIEAGLGATEAASLGKILGPAFSKVPGLKKAWTRFVLEGASEESMQEFSQELGTWAARSAFGIEDRKLLDAFDQAIYQASLGAGVGGGLAAGTGALAVTRPEGPPEGPQERPGAPQAPEGPAPAQPEEMPARAAVEAPGPEVAQAAAEHFEKAGVKGRLVEPQTPEELGAFAFEAGFGRTLALVEAEDGAPMGLPATAGEGVTVMDVNARDGLRPLLFHEAVHGIPKAEDRRKLVSWFKEAAPGLWERMREQYAKEFKIKARSEGELPSAQLDEEAVAKSAEALSGVLGALYADANLIHDLATKDRGLLQKVLDAVVRVLNMLPGVNLPDAAVRELADLRRRLTGPELEGLSDIQVFELAEEMKGFLDLALPVAPEETQKKPAEPETKPAAPDRGEAVEAVTVAELPQEEALFGEQEKQPKPRKEGAPVRGEQAKLWTGQEDQPGQQSLEDMMDAGQLEAEPKKKPAAKKGNYKARALEGEEGLRRFAQAKGGLKWTEDLQNLTEEGVNRPPGFHAIVQKEGSGKGMSLDELGEAAWEAGLFPERPTPAQVLETLYEGQERPVEAPEPFEAGGGLDYSIARRYAATFSEFLIPTGALADMVEKAKAGELKPPPPEVDIPAAGEPQMEQVLDSWLSDRQTAVARFDADAAVKQEQIEEIVRGKPLPKGLKGVVREAFAGRMSKDARESVAAIALYIDLKEADANGNPDEFALYREQLTEAQVAKYERSQNLSDKEREFAETIIRENRELGIQAMDADVTRSYRENYSARIWKPREEGSAPEGVAKFTLKTGRARARSYSSILQGWALGRELQVEDAIEAQHLARTQIAQVIYDRNLMMVAKKSGLISPTRADNSWVEVEHPNFRTWVHAGKAEAELSSGVAVETFGKGIYADADGNLFRQVPMYAEPKLGKALNRILGRSKIRDLPAMESITRLNAYLKAQVLFSSLFHHQAYLRSFLLGAPVSWKHLNIVQSYYDGRKALEQWTPDVDLLARQGLTIGNVQDFEERALSEEGKIAALIDKTKLLAPARKALLALMRQQVHFLFKRMGPNLKVMSALLELKHLRKKHRKALESGAMTQEEIATIAAEMINADFGGLNLQRKRRDPTVQHIFRLFALAPDWTESNVETMWRGFVPGKKGSAYRDMWWRVFWKGMGITAIFNALMAAADDEEDFWGRYKRAWNKGHFRWLAVDVTPMAVGGDTDSIKYYSIIGHFKDPLKFILHPGVSAKHKSSILGGLLIEALMGTDWAGRGFTDWKELLGIDYDKGTYKTSRRNADGTWRHRAGDPKAGQLRGHTVAWGSGGGTLEPEQLPSFLVNQARGVLPIPLQNAMGWLAGEMDAFDAITKSLGLTTTSTRKEKK